MSQFHSNDLTEEEQIQLAILLSQDSHAKYSANHTNQVTQSLVEEYLHLSEEEEAENIALAIATSQMEANNKSHKEESQVEAEDLIRPQELFEFLSSDEELSDEIELQLAMAVSQMCISPRQEAQTSRSTSNENRRDNAEGCVVCRASQPNHIFLDCKHIVCCEDCASQFSVFSRYSKPESSRCPVCRKPLTQLPAKVFF